MTREEAVAALRALQRGNSEARHSEADDILIAFLRDAGYADVADAWCEAEERIEFWYG
jgi:hypothetical protein